MPFLAAIPIGVAIAGGAAASAGASLVGAGIQSSAGKSAAQLQYQEQQQALQFQEKQYATQQQQEAPYVQAGQGAIGTLSNLVSQEAQGQGPLAPWTQQFQAPNLNETTDPGYLARLQLGQQTVENSAAARGGLLTGGTAKDLTNYAQTFASNEYGNVFNRAVEQYQQAYNIFQNNQQNLFNRTASVAQGGQQAVGTGGQLGQAAANNIGNISLTGGAQQAGALQNAAYQTASGYTGAANALTGGISNISGLSMLQQLLQQQQFQQQPYNPADVTPPIINPNQNSGAPYYE